jgi:hypothetical protein
MPHRASAMLRRVSALVTVLSTMLVLGATPAQAFTSGPHEEIVDDAMTAEGFSRDAVELMQVNNTYTDLYQWVGATANPYSGHGGILNRALVGNLKTEKWPIDLVAAATRSHFDNSPEAPIQGRMPTLGTTEGVTTEYERLQKSVWAMVREARDENDPEKLLAVLGTSVHQIQDFYAHTNWVEPTRGGGVQGSDGPGWRGHGFGSFPTWYDVPASARAKTTIYGDSTPGHYRHHGFWSSDGNLSLRTMMNKDSVGRPYYLEAAITAYYATRQWTQAVRGWLDDEAFWQKAQNFKGSKNYQRELRRDHDGLFNIMIYAGRWEGQGEPVGGPGETGPSGSAYSFIKAGKNYFEGQPKSAARSYFERMIRRLAKPKPVGEVGPVPSSQELQANTKVVVARIVQMRERGIGDPLTDDADMYMKLGIGGQAFETETIHGHDSFGFNAPNAPFTRFKVVPAVIDTGDPVESIEVEVRTADARWAGTDDEVFLQLGQDLKFKLDKRQAGEFERGWRDTFSVPIDAAVRDGMRVSDITMVQIVKPKDGIGGGWKLGGVKLRVNGSEVYDMQGIDTWLDDDQRGWRGPGFKRAAPHGAEIPVWFELDEDDLLYGDDDQGDINPDDGRDVVSVGYLLGTTVKKTTVGGERLGGEFPGDGRNAQITYTLETITPELMGTSGPTTLGPPQTGRADLVITALDSRAVTVKNQGNGPAGPFRLLVEGPNTVDTPVFSGLAAGASETRALGGLACESVSAIVDDLRQVAEDNETNNGASTGEVIC